MLKTLVRFFDKLEDKIRAKLSRHPVVYALIGGVGVVLFWRGVWHIADDLGLHSVTSIVLGTIILLLTGVFVSAFIGSRVILSGLKGEEKIVEKAEESAEASKQEIVRLEEEIKKVEKHISHLESEVIHSHNHHHRP